MFDKSKIDQLRDLVDNDPVELASLVEEYESNSAKLLGQIREALERRQAQELSRGVHTLKSSSALMGAAGLARQCEELEQQTRFGSIPEDAGPKVTALETSYREAMIWLKGQLDAG
jgi:HPt (histidine-containing phosphotransfer) domain-containing protein